MVFFKEKKLINILCFSILILFIIISSWSVINNSINFHTDIARDFLLLEDIVINKPLTLIGPRSSLPGVFHGPLWLYLNLPAFIIGKGNPVTVGWFWVFLYGLTLYFIYKISFFIFKSKDLSIKATVLVASVFVFYVNRFFNPYGAVILFPIFFYFYWQYFLTLKNKNLLISLLILGLIIQFQIAFGGPIFLLVFFHAIHLIFKKKKPLWHFFLFLVILFPLLTFLVFELRHDFIQTKSVLGYFLNNKKGLMLDLDLLLKRLRGLLFEEIFFIFRNIILYLLFLFNFFLFLLKFFLGKKRFTNNKNIYYLFFYFLLGFWFLTLFYRGNIYYYYYLPFIPLIIIIFCSWEKYLNKYLFLATFFLTIFFNLYLGYKENVRLKSYYQFNSSSWSFYYHLANDIFKDADREFGYYIFTPDLFGYSVRYGLNYTQKKYLDKKASPFIKKKTTYLIIAPPPDDKPFLNGEWWKINQVKINKKPQNVFKYSNGYRVEKYILSDEEIKIPSDPNLLQTLHFR